MLDNVNKISFKGDRQLLFSSTIFLFVFLPIVICIYYIILRKSTKLQNIFLLLASIGFYAWGEPKFVFIMLLSIFSNYIFARIICFFEKSKRNNICKLCLCFCVIFNLSILFIYKYLNFVIENINHIYRGNIPQTQIVLPIGISFFTFQAMSYVIDVYRGNVKVQKNVLYVALYISFFPQLIAGPIVRYTDIEKRIYDRNCNLEDITIGVRKFIGGLAKKVIISNQLACFADMAFNTVKQGQDISLIFAWGGAIAYTLQIYFDFDGYSQMAIGLGKIFGFDFPENFNYPYISKSITEFWRRWHISLSTWFRDYLYIPLGGSRVDSKLRHIFNLLIVWLCTGIWHGANWTFISWGGVYFILLFFEKYSKAFKFIKKCPAIIQHLYTMFFVIMAWVLFRADSINVAVQYMFQMFGKSGKFIDNYALQYLGEYKTFLVIASLYAVALFRRIDYHFLSNQKYKNVITVFSPIFYMILFIVSTAYLVMGTYNPFIYFNF